MQKNSLIQVQNLYKTYKSKLKDMPVLKDINIGINKSEFTVIFGPSGSGKSTLLNLLVGLEVPTHGGITIGNFSISENSEELITKFRKDRIGIIYQQAYWIKALNVLQNIAFPLTLKGVPKYIAFREALIQLERVGLTEWSSFHPSELSVGQQQKVSLARALITNPEILVADEPTGNLDYKSGQELTKQLKDLTLGGTTVIMITHNLDNLDYAERVIKMLDGEIIEDIILNEKNLEEVKRALIINKAIEIKPINPLHQEERDEVKPDNHFSITNNFIVNFFKSIIHLILIVVLTIISLIYMFIYSIFNFKFLPHRISNLKYKLDHIAFKVADKFNKNKESIKHLDLFDLSVKNLFAKKSRAIVTIGGIALGIGFTTLLISFGFGLEKLVINRVANLEELKEIDVFPAIGDSIELNDQTIETFKNINNTEKVYPVITLAGNITYEESNTDAVVYAVQSDYLTKTSHIFTEGKAFNENELNRTEDDLTFETVVNREFINLIGISENDILNKFISIKYIPGEDLLLEETDFDSEASYLYKVVGIVDYKSTPIIFTPIISVKSLGITNYTQARLIATQDSNVEQIRQELNALGYRSNSILDTVNEISSFFQTARIVFASIGFVALFVASLGMFNTLTVSLLERIREVGLMKAMGMSKNEVRNLFLTEAMTMSILGGTFGIAFGLLIGNLISLVLSFFSVTRGFEYINIVHLPFGSMVLIMFVAGITGALTGFYPAKRATNISALDALRYE